MHCSICELGWGINETHRDKINQMLEAGLPYTTISTVLKIVYGLTVSRQVLSRHNRFCRNQSMRN